MGRSLHRRGSQLWLSRLSPLSTTRLPWGLGWQWGEAGADGRASWGPAQAPPPQGKGVLRVPRQEHGPCVGLSLSCSVLWLGCSLSWLLGPAQLSSFAALWGPEGPSPAPTTGTSWTREKPGIDSFGALPTMPSGGCIQEFWHHTGKYRWLSSHLS